MGTIMVRSPARSGVRTLSRAAAVVILLSMSVGGVPGIAAAATPGSQQWVKRYNGPANLDDYGGALGVSPDGSTVFVAGTSNVSEGSSDYTTAAYDASTGATLWVKRYTGPRNSVDNAVALGVSPDGSRVFVTGSSLESGGSSDYATVAYDALSGDELWVKRYNGAANLNDFAIALEVNPDGSGVFVAGRSSSTTDDDYATVAYDAITGARLWAKRYHGRAGGSDSANALGVSADGSQVFVTGTSVGSGNFTDYATVAYDAVTGAKLWSKRHDGSQHGPDEAQNLGVSPDGSQVFVTGISFGFRYYNYATLAYDAATGARLWSKRYTGPGNASDFAYALGVSPDGSTVFVTGGSNGATSFWDYVTLAYDTSTGAELWVKRYNGAANSLDIAYSLAVSPDGSEVFVTGVSLGSASDYDYATVAYDVTVGTKLWAKRYNGPGNAYDQANAVGVSPDGSTVFVTGQSAGSTNDDYATVAYGIT